jgi:large conductance mechanosensitive channel
MRIILSRTIKTLSTERVGVATFAVAAGLALYNLFVTLAYDVVLPVINAIVGVNLLQEGIQIGRRAQVLNNEVYAGRVIAETIAILIAGILGVWLLPRMWRNAEADLRACPFCLSDIPLEATKCAYCASGVTPVPIED